MWGLGRYLSGWIAFHTSMTECISLYTQEKKKYLQYCTSVAPVNNGGHTGQPIYPKLWEPGSMKHSVSRNKKKMD